jgi:hypothetical protein
MCKMAAANGIDIKIVDDPNYQPTEEDRRIGTKIIVFSQGKGGLGHFYLLGKEDI